MRLLTVFAFLFSTLSLHAQLEEDTMSYETINSLPFLTNVKKAAKNPAQAIKLDLRNTGLTEIPPEVFLLTELRVLMIDSNKITSIPAEIGNLKKLRALYASVNQISTLPAEMGKMEGLHYLYLSHNQFTEMPQPLFSLRQLALLVMNGNKIKAIPENIGKLKELRVLWLPVNEIESVPIDIGHLYNLEELSIAQNKVKTLPNEFFLLTNLVNLYLGENELTAISDSIGNLQYLEELTINHNKLKTLPASIGNLGHVKSLGLAANLLETVPADIVDMVALEELDLAGNPLKDLPQEMLMMQKLKKIDVEDVVFHPFPQMLYDLANNGVEITGLKTKEIYNVKLLMSKGKNMALTGDHAGAISKYNEVIKLDTNNAVAMYGLAEAYLETSKYDSTVLMCERALRKNPPAELIGKIKTTLLKGENKTNKYDELAAVYVNKTKEHPDKAAPYYDLGVFYYNVQKFDEAKDALLKAIDRDANYASAHFYLAVTLLSMDSMNKDEKPFVYQALRFLSIEPTGIRARTMLPFLMSKLHMRLGRTTAKDITTTYHDDFIVRDENREVIYKSEDPKADLLAAMLFELTMKDVKGGNKKEDALMKSIMSQVFNTDKSNPEIFIIQVKKLFDEPSKETPELENDDDEKQKQPSEAEIFFKTKYAGYFKEMIANGHLETFAYLVMNQRAPEKEADAWMKSHGAQVKAFKTWSEGFKW